MAGNENVRSEDVLGQKWDKCLSDTAMKFGWGVGLGIVASVLFFKKKPWPAVFGAGFGLGMGCANCGHQLQQPYTTYLKKIKIPIESKTESS